MVYGCVPLSAVSFPSSRMCGTAVCSSGHHSLLLPSSALCSGRVTGLPGLHPHLCVRGASVCHQIGFSQQLFGVCASSCTVRLILTELDAEAPAAAVTAVSCSLMP